MSERWLTLAEREDIVTRALAEHTAQVAAQRAELIDTFLALAPDELADLVDKLAANPGPWGEAGRLALLHVVAARLRALGR